MTLSHTLTQRLRATLLLASSLLGISSAVATSAAEWPTYGHDPARSHITSETLPWPLAPRWQFQSTYAPQPAWDDPKSGEVEGILELPRVRFDACYEPAAAGNAVWFGSSGDHKIYCLDAASGRTRWSVSAGGPVRLAPTLSSGRLYVGSDDGYVYCLGADDGRELWKYHAAPEERRVLGHGQLISLWPVRTGVLVDADTAYFGAGIFPSEGVFLFAVDAATGRLRWRNDTGGETAQSRISPQGYLLASPDTLYVPMGRTSPAAYDRATGRLREQTWFGKTVGGAFALLAGQQVYTGTEEIEAYSQESSKSSDRFVIFGGHKLVVRDDTAYVAAGERLLAIDRAAYARFSKQHKSQLSKREQLQEGLYGIRKVRDELKKDLARIAGDLKLIPPETSVERLNQERTTKSVALASAVQKEQEVSRQFREMDATIRQAEGKPGSGVRWSLDAEADQALILAGNTLYAGGQDVVLAVDATTGRKLGTLPVPGKAMGLAVAGGRLIVSTDRGAVAAFAPPIAADTAATAPGAASNNTSPAVDDPNAVRAAEAILAQTGIRRGFCLLWGCESGRLAIELARRSELRVYAVDADAEKVAAARKAVDAAGLLGGRICVEAWPWDHVPYADYFANVIVSETALATGKLPGSASDLLRMLKPEGGVLALAGPAAAADAALRTAVEAAHVPNLSFAESRGGVLQAVRGALPNAGSWTHLYARPDNTACGDDRLVRAPLRVLWYGSPGPGNMVNRHERSMGPLVLDGRIFSEGENLLMAYDAYNGVCLWQRAWSGARRTHVSETGGNMAVNRQALLVATGNTCWRIDPASGATRGSYRLPSVLPAADDSAFSTWGYLACTETTLFGTRSEGAGHRDADAVFALDLASGKTLWTYHGSRIPVNTIALDGERLYLVDAEVTPTERAAALREREEWLAQLSPAARRDVAPLRTLDIRRVVCLDAQTGNVRWQRGADLSLGPGGSLSAMCQHGRLVLFNVYTDGHYWKQFFGGQFASRRVSVLDGGDGSLRWSKTIGYRVRPLLIGDTLHAEPWAFDLHTGEEKQRINPLTGLTERWQFARPGHHCGCPSAAPECLFFRSLTLGYYDLAGDFGTQHFDGQRPGCWINFVPAAGLLIMPEASAGCMCSFPNMCSVVFQPSSVQKTFGLYSAAGETTPVRRLALAFGAAGDRNDSTGQLWLSCPRPSKGSLVLPLDVTTSFANGGGYLNRNATYTPIAGTPDPWLFASAARGLVHCSIPLLGPGDPASVYRVRLCFADPENDAVGQRVFGVKLQGKTVLAACDVAGEAGGRDRALVKEFSDIAVRDTLELDLVPSSAAASAAQMPILQGIEILRQRMDGLGCNVPQFELSAARPAQTQTLELTNFQDATYAGTLRFEAPAGLTVTPAETSLSLPRGKRIAVPVTVTVAAGTKAGQYALAVRVARADGHADIQRTAVVEHLGRITRMVLPAVEDAYVIARYPDLNKGTVTSILVDGGDQAMNDLGHAVGLIKFRGTVPGRIHSLRLRLHNAGNPTADSGRVRLVSEPWSEQEVTYQHQPKLGADVARLGSVAAHESVECRLNYPWDGKSEFSLALDPTSCDGVDYLARESGDGPKLIVEYEPEE